MIQGKVNANRTPVVRLKVYGATGFQADLDAVVDTGYTGTLTVPVAIVTLLGLVQASTSAATIADGSKVSFKTYSAEMDWDGTRRPVIDSATGKEPLLGMKLMEGHELRMEIVLDGAVELRPLPAKQP